MEVRPSFFAWQILLQSLEPRKQSQESRNVKVRESSYIERLASISTLRGASVVMTMLRVYINQLAPAE